MSSTPKAIGRRSSDVAKPTYWPMRLRNTPSSEAADRPRRPGSRARRARRRRTRRAGSPASSSAGGTATARSSSRRPRRARRRGPSRSRASSSTRTPTSDAAAGRSAAARIASPSFVNWKSSPEQDHGEDRDEQHAEVLARERDAADVVDVVAERRRHELQVGAPLPRDEAVDQDEEADGDDHDRDHRPVLHGPDRRRAGSRRRARTRSRASAKNATQYERPQRSAGSAM